MDDRAPDRRLQLVLRVLDDAYDKPAWHGPNLRSSVRRVPVDAAAWRPADGHPNIWELVIHSAYWKYVVRRKLRGEKRGGFPRKGSDWFASPDSADGDPARRWKEDLALLDEMHASLREGVSAMTEADLDAPVSKAMTAQVYLLSLAAHDLYHAGQIQTIRHLYRRRAGAPSVPPPSS